MGYGDYDINKPYASKKGKNWYKTGSAYGISNSHFDFTNIKTTLLNEIESSNKRYNGLQPYAPIPKDKRLSVDNSLYFAIKDEKVLMESLISIMEGSIIPQDIVITNRSNKVITGYDQFGNPMYNVVNDVFNTIMTRDSLTRSYLNNQILAYCFVYNLPDTILYDISIYNNIIHIITTGLNFRDRTMLIRTDIINSRVIFIVSNVIEDPNSLDKYAGLYYQGKRKEYSGKDILFSRHPDTSYDKLDNTLDINFKSYINGIKLYIGKRKDINI